MKKCVRMQKLDMRRCDNGCMQYQNIQTMRMFSKEITEVLNDIRQYFRIQVDNRDSGTHVMQQDTGFNEHKSVVMAE